MALPDLAWDVATTVAGSCLLATLVWAVTWGRRWLREDRQMKRDWHGARPREGFAEVPGVPKRLQAVEADVRDLKDTIRRELVNGRPLVDKVDAILRFHHIEVPERTET